MATLTPPGPPPPPGPAGPPRPLPEGTASWRDGQVMKALVQQGTGQPGQVATLRIGRVDVPVNAQTALLRGSELLVQVVRQQQSLALRLLEPPPAPGNGPRQAALTEAFAQALRNLAPRQESPTRLLALLQAVVTRPPGSDAPPEALRQLVREAIARLPGPRELSQPDSLRRLVEQALTPLPAGTTSRPASETTGSLRELVARLIALLAPREPGPARSQPPLTPLPTRSDAPPTPAARWGGLPAQLTVPQLLAELFAAARGTEARQGLQQLAAVEGLANGEQRLQLELPLRLGNGLDLLSLVIRREGGRGQADDTTRPWQATLAIALPDLGGIQAHIALARQRVTVDFHVEEPATLRRLEGEIDRLQHALRARAIEVQRISARLGEMPPQDQPPRDRLVDISV